MHPAPCPLSARVGQVGDGLRLDARPPAAVGKQQRQLIRDAVQQRLRGRCGAMSAGMRQPCTQCRRGRTCASKQALCTLEGHTGCGGLTPLPAAAQSSRPSPSQAYHHVGRKRHAAAVHLAECPGGVGQLLRAGSSGTRCSCFSPACKAAWLQPRPPASTLQLNALSLPRHRLHGTHLRPKLAQHAVGGPHQRRQQLRLQQRVEARQRGSQLQVMRS